MKKVEVAVRMWRFLDRLKLALFHLRSWYRSHSVWSGERSRGPLLGPHLLKPNAHLRVQGWTEYRTPVLTFKLRSSSLVLVRHNYTNAQRGNMLLCLFRSDTSLVLNVWRAYMLIMHKLTLSDSHIRRSICEVYPPEHYFCSFATWHKIMLIF